jgi:hypothetical protein
LAAKKKEKRKSKLRISINVFSNFFSVADFSKTLDLKNLKWNVLLQIGWYSKKKECANFIEGKKKFEKILAIFQHSFLSFGAISFSHFGQLCHQIMLLLYLFLIFFLLMLCEKIGKSTTLASIIEQMLLQRPPIIHHCSIMEYCKSIFELILCLPTLIPG